MKRRKARLHGRRVQYGVHRFQLGGRHPVLLPGNPTPPPPPPGGSAAPARSRPAARSSPPAPRNRTARRMDTAAAPEPASAPRRPSGRLSSGKRGDMGLLVGHRGIVDQGPPGIGGDDGGGSPPRLPGLAGGGAACLAAHRTGIWARPGGFPRLPGAASRRRAGPRGAPGRVAGGCAGLAGAAGRQRPRQCDPGAPLVGRPLVLSLPRPAARRVQPGARPAGDAQGPRAAAEGAGPRRRARSVAEEVGDLSDDPRAQARDTALFTLL